MNLRKWFGFENEDHEGSSPGEYTAFAEQIELSPSSQRDHDEYVRRVATEHGFTLSEWTPTIPTRSRV